ERVEGRELSVVVLPGHTCDLTCDPCSHETGRGHAGSPLHRNSLGNHSRGIMITLYVAGPNFGLPDPSPFVSKAEVLLKMSGLPYRTEPANFSKAPKHKIPYFEDGGKLFGDSTFLRFHLETAHGIDFDKGLTTAERGAAWAFEKLAEDHLYWAL